MLKLCEERGLRFQIYNMQIAGILGYKHYDQEIENQAILYLRQPTLDK